MIYEIAGLRIQINNKYEYTTKFCREYLSPDQLSPAILSATVSEEEFLAEKALSSGFSDGYIENIAELDDILLGGCAFPGLIKGIGASVDTQNVSHFLLCKLKAFS